MFAFNSCNSGFIFLIVLSGLDILSGPMICCKIGKKKSGQISLASWKLNILWFEEYKFQKSNLPCAYFSNGKRGIVSFYESLSSGLPIVNNSTFPPHPTNHPSLPSIRYSFQDWAAVFHHQMTQLFLSLSKSAVYSGWCSARTVCIFMAGYKVSKHNNI